MSATRIVAVASALAIGLATQPAWGHRFPEVRTIVVQVEACEVALLVGFRPGSGEPTEAILTRAASAPRAKSYEALRDLMGSYAMAPLTVSVDGKPLIPTSASAKIGIEPGSIRPMVVMLVTFALPPPMTAQKLTILSRDPRSTRISWQDQASGRVAIPNAPQQGKWHGGVASFLLELLPTPPGASTCAKPSSTRSSASASSPAR